MRSWLRAAPRACLLVLALFLLAALPGCSRTYSEHLLAAQNAEQQGNMAAALDAYQQALERLPRRDHRVASTIHLRIGLCHLSLAQPNEAFLSFQRAVLTDSSNLEAHRRMAEMLLVGGATEKAAEELNAILRKDPNDAASLGALGVAYASAGDVKAALTLLERSFSINPGDHQVSIPLAEVYNRLDRAQDARRVLVQSATRNAGVGDAWLALGRLEEQEGQAAAAESAYRSAVVADDSVRNNLRLAQFLQRSARIADAEAVLRRVDAKQPRSPSALADFLLVTGRAEAAANIYQGVLPAAADKALVARSIEARISPGSADSESAARAARRLLLDHLDHLDPATRSILQAEIALRENDLRTAEVHARAAVQHQPDSVPALFVLGTVFKHSGRRAEAKAAWNQAFQANPEYIPTRLALAAENLEDQDWLTAEEQIMPVVREEPANLQALLLYAQALIGQQRWPAAESISRRALEVAPRDPEAHVALAEALAGRRLYADALTSYQRALALDSQSVPALHGLTALYRRGAVTRSAVQRMELVASAPPVSTALLEVAGRLYADLGLFSDARRALERSLELDPHRASAALALVQVALKQKDTRTAASFAAVALGKVKPAVAELIQGREAELRLDRAAAIRHYEAAVRLGEGSGAAANNLAWIYAQQGIRLDRALELARRATELDPKNPSIWDTLGAVHLRRRDYTAATEALTSARALSESSGQPDSARRHIYKRLAEAYIGAGLPDRAAEAHRRARQ